MKNYFKAYKSWIVIIGISLFWLSNTGAIADTIDFEGVPHTYNFYGENGSYDTGVNLNGYYSGVSFGPTATILEANYYWQFAGYYPPHSGVGVLYSHHSPYINVVFDEPVSNIGLWYTTRVADIFVDAYSDSAMTNLLGKAQGYLNSGISSELRLDFSGIRAIKIYSPGALLQGCVVDDISFSKDTQVVEIDPGHGKNPKTNQYDQRGKSPTYGVYEDEFDLWLAQNLGNKLKADNYGTYMTRNNEYRLKAVRGEDLRARTELANRQHKPKPTVFVSIHCNAGPSTAHGAELVFYKDHNQRAVESWNLANKILPELAGIGLKNRGIIDDTKTAEGAVYVLRNTDMKAVVVEAAFFTNNKFDPNDKNQTILDEDRLYDPMQRDNIAGAIRNGIKNYLEGK